ncbi:efflux RND transporter permease subunit [Desulfosarcina variabilis]|uniref:efflux RND transporter permease subunit n=1 Tax=Desulfosarcina variabilis TaxID=2300 RepID=UPI003AFB2B50
MNEADKQTDNPMKRPMLRVDRRNRGPIAWMAGHTVAANLLMVVLLVGGLIFAGQIKKEVFPDFELDIVEVSVPYPGASPEEVERGTILAIEEAVQGLDGVKQVTAEAKEGMGLVTIEIMEGKNIQRVAQDVQSEVDRISSFPDEAEDPEVIIAQRRRYVVSLALFGDVGESILRETAERVRDRLLQDPGITQVDLNGIRDYEISISVSQSTLRAYGLSLEGIAQTIRRAAVELPGGSIKTESGDVLVRMTERRDFGPEFGRIPIITTNDGTQVLLSDIADVNDGFEETDNFASYNGHPAILVDVYRVGDQTPLDVSQTVSARLEEIRPDLPPGIDLISHNDRSDIYRQRMDLMLRNGYLGLSLVFVLLAIFLEPRLAFWVSLGIPISILGSLYFLPAAGVSINVISMFAFIVTLGIVVDDAIVAGENMYHHHQAGKPWLHAAVSGTREISMPVIFSVLTNIVAFSPLLFVSGFMGKVFRQIPIVVVAVFTVSLIESLLILPAHIGHRRSRPDTGLLGWILRQQRRFSDWFSRFIHTRYGPLLGYALNRRYIVLSVGVVVLMLTVSYVKSGRMGFELFPKIESDYAQATAVLPYGSSVRKTQAVQQTLVAAAQRLIAEHGGDTPLAQGIFAEIEGNKTEVRVYLVPPDVRPLSTAQLTALWREQVGPLPGLESLKFESDAGGPGRGAALSVELSHRNVQILAQAGADVAAALEFYPNVSDIDDGYSPGKRQLDFKIRPEARSLGLRAEDVARQLRHAYYGAEALRQQRGRNEVKVMVRLPKDERVSEHHLETMILRTPAGKEIPLLEAVDIQRGRAYTSIDRRSGRRVITVSADVRPRSQADRVLASLTQEILPTLKDTYPGLTYSFEGRQADRRESMHSLMMGLMFAVLVIYAMLAIPFNSFVQPFIIMLSIPFGIVGAVIGHMIMGYSLSVMSMFGVVALSGVVINDSLVLIDFANRRRRVGETSVDAIHHAGIHRFRPILLTTLTTFGGLAPMIFETSRQARFLIPMALSLGFGILFATVITLILVPCFFLVVEDLKKVIGRADHQVIYKSGAS